VAACSKAWTYDRWLAGNAGSNPAGGMKPVVRCHVEISARGWSLVKKGSYRVWYFRM
jgi:hypothetical protein